MLSILLASSLLFGAQDTPLEVPYVLSEADTVIFPIGDLTGADELAELRDAILSETLPVSVRRASLDRYTTVLEGGAVKGAAESLARSLKLFVDPLDDPAFEVSVASPSQIEIKGTDEQREWAWGFLDASRKALESETLLEFEVKIYSAPRGTREKVLAQGAGLSLAPAEAEELEKTLGAMEGVDIVSAPRVTVHVGAPAEISVIESIPYIREYETTILPDLETEICDPVIATVQDGLTLRVRGAYVSEETLKVRTEFTSSSVRRPLQQIERPVGSAGNVVTLQIPEVKTVQASASFDVKEESVIVLSTVDPGFEGGEARDVLLVVRTLVLEPYDPGKEVK